MKSVRITMKTLAAGPDGALQAGHSYLVPDQVSRAQAEELLDGGYAILDGQTAPAAAAAAEDGDGKPLEKRTVEELKAYADEQDIDLGPAAKKAEILDVITAELAKREAGGGD